MVEAQSSVQLCFPVELKNGTMVSCLFYIYQLNAFVIDYDQAFLTIILLTGYNEFPVEKETKRINTWQVEEIHFVGFLNKLLETKLIQVLRFKHGQVCLQIVILILNCNISQPHS